MRFCLVRWAPSPQATRPSISGGPVGFPSPGYPDFGFILKAGCGLAPASHLLLHQCVKAFCCFSPSFPFWIIEPAGSAQRTLNIVRQVCDPGFLFPSGGQPSTLNLIKGPNRECASISFLAFWCAKNLLPVSKGPCNTG